MLYLADREALNRWGFNITTDHYVSKEHGPVVSNIYNLVTIDERENTFWARYITPPLGMYEVALKSGEIPERQLSPAEERLLSEIFDTYGTWSRWELRDVTHSLKEWHDLGTSSLPIPIRDILLAQGQSAEEAEDTLADLRADEKADCVLAGR